MTRKKKLQNLPKRVAKPSLQIFRFADASTRALADFAAQLPLLLFTKYKEAANSQKCSQNSIALVCVCVTLGLIGILSDYCF